jgi:N-acetylglucosaminyl-diphospho-decaprenol L-rhamnosyltransferase
MSIPQKPGQSICSDQETSSGIKPGIANDNPLVVVAIVSTNDIHNILGCLKSLTTSTHRNFWIVICENGGPEAFDRARKSFAETNFIREGKVQCRDVSLVGWTQGHVDFYLADWKQPVTLLRSAKNLGYAGGVNACIVAAANAPWDAVWVLNPDTFPEPDALAALVRRQKEGNYGMVGSRLVFVASGLVQAWGGLLWFPLLGRGRLLGFNQPADTMPDIADIERRMACISGASMYVTRAYVETIGMMDEEFFVYDEDVDWCQRRGSFRLGYAHDSLVRHIHGATAGASSTHKASRSRFNIYLTERNRILLARKRFGAQWPLFAGIVLLQTSEHLIRVRSFRQFSFAVEGWWAGVRGETGAPGFMRSAKASDISQFFDRKI